MSTNVKQAKNKAPKADGAALAGRIRKLNQLAGQHAANSGQTREGSVAAAVSAGSGKRDGGSVRNSAPNTPLPPVKAAAKAAAPKKKAAHPPPQHPARKLKARVYHNKDGKELARSEVVVDDAPFNTRMGKVSKSDFAAKAVGLNASQVYHGSKTMEKDFVKSGVRGTRIAGSQYLDVVETGGQNNTTGARLTTCLVNPTALGVQLAKMAQLFEQSKVHHMKVIYKPVVSATTDGAIAMYFRNDVSNPMLEVGLDELQHAASHSSFQDSTVWTPMSIDISPSDVMLKYWDEMSGDYASDIQGIVTVLASSNLSADTVYGHLYIEFDVEFFSPEVDYEVSEIGVHNIVVEFNAFPEPAAGEPVVVPWRAAAPGAGQCGWRWLTTSPENSECSPYGPIVHVNESTAVPWCTLQDLNQKIFAAGQNFFCRFVGVPGASTWLGVDLLLFADLDSSSGPVAVELDQTTPGQLIYDGAGVPAMTEVIIIRGRILPLASAE